MEQLVPLLLLIAIFYFLLIRPQQRRVKQHHRLTSSIEVGDEILTIGGIYGTVRELDDATMLIEVAPGTSIKFARSAISRRLTEEYEVSEESQEDGQPAAGTE